ncbi:unnamed protein product [Acanthoscelides obtectus]|uniref:DDE-1 domain-containing protein n=1 Tax=Acanthoscelides obtectus TaxID=200917 RepID=A0A9P0Q4J4_ACAOB|nr:unnamed protein product [Acanthoscelides obtectus]CAK1633627.1 hypothetical protein AOBTE_LOCUS8270 [Acanthoscelides obtectus]
MIGNFCHLGVNHEVQLQKMSKVLENVAPEAVVNYETNFSDDPGLFKVIVKKQSKRTEKTMDTSKSCISVMFACSTSGVMLPPYVVYKADHLWSTWTEGGPANTRYNKSPSGWFDGNIFDDWFLSIALTYFKTLPPGRKVLIGDNLASHISIEVIRKCEENDICFVLLPPNSTHLTQPLDVGVFRPINVKWRQVLKDWKAKNKGTIRKDRRQRGRKLTQLSFSSSDSSDEDLALPLHLQKSYTGRDDSDDDPETFSDLENDTLYNETFEDENTPENPLENELGAIKQIKCPMLRSDKPECCWDVQGRDKELSEVISDIKTIIKKLEFWEQSLIDGDTRYFPALSEKISILTICSKYHVEKVSSLNDNFKNRFKDFSEIAIVVQLVVSPFMEIEIQQFATSVTQNFGEDIARQKWKTLLESRTLTLWNLDISADLGITLQMKYVTIYIAFQPVSRVDTSDITIENKQYLVEDVNFSFDGVTENDFDISAATYLYLKIKQKRRKAFHVSTTNNPKLRHSRVIYTGQRHQRGQGRRNPAKKVLV